MKITLCAGGHPELDRRQNQAIKDLIERIAASPGTRHADGTASSFIDLDGLGPVLVRVMTGKRLPVMTLGSTELRAVAFTRLDDLLDAAVPSVVVINETLMARSTTPVISTTIWPTPAADDLHFAQRLARAIAEMAS